MLSFACFVNDGMAYRMRTGRIRVDTFSNRKRYPVYINGSRCKPPVRIFAYDDWNGNSKERRRNRNGGYSCFDMSKTPAVYLECVSATGVTQDLADNSTVSFSAVLSPTTASTCIVVVANKELDNIVPGFIKGTTTKVEAMERCSTPRPANGWQTVRRLMGIRGFRCTGRR